MIIFITKFTYPAEEAGAEVDSEVGACVQDEDEDEEEGLSMESCVWDLRTICTDLGKAKRLWS